MMPAAGSGPSARSGRCRRKPASRSFRTSRSFRSGTHCSPSTRAITSAAISTAATASARRRAFRIATSTTTTTRSTTASSPDSAKPRIPSPINGSSPSAAATPRCPSIFRITATASRTTGRTMKALPSTRPRSRPRPACPSRWIPTTCSMPPMPRASGPAAATRRCRDIATATAVSIRRAIPNGAPLTYNSDTTQSFEVGSKNSVSDRFRIATSVYYIKWKNIQQNVYVPYNCGLQFTDNLGTAVAKGFDLQAEMVLGAGFTRRRGVRLHQRALHRVDAAAEAPAGTGGRCDLRRGRHRRRPGHQSAVHRVASAPSTASSWRRTTLSCAWTGSTRRAITGWPGCRIRRRCSIRRRPTPCPSTSFASARGGLNFGNWQVALFCDNLFDSRTTINYQLSQADANSPAYAADPNAVQSVQQNTYTWRPRTIGITATFRR